MNPIKYAQMIKYLTRAKKQKPDLPDVFPASQAPIPAKSDFVETKDAINRFVLANPRKDMAGGGMLVQPGFGGTRQGYREPRRTDESYRKVVKDFVATSGPGTGSVFDDPAAIDIVKAELNRIKKQRNNKNLFEWSEKSDWYKNLQKRLNPNTKKGLNREFTNKLINQVVDEFFPGAYHGKDAIKNFRNDMVVKSFIQHLKSVGEFDGQEKFDKVLDQFTKGKDLNHKYENINRSWKQWIAGEFEVDGVDRAQLKKELKARGIDYSQIDNWKAAQTQKRGTEKIAEIKFLDNQNSKFPNRSLEQVEELFKKKFPNSNFYLRVNNLTEIKRNGVYVSGATSERSITGIGKGDRAGWLKKAYGKQFAGNYSKIINAADQLAAAGETAKAERLYKAADKFFGPTGIIRKSAVGEAEHALARSFDFLNPDRQLAINSIVSGDLNQFKKNLFDIPVKNYFDEYNNPNTTKARKVELKNLIEERKKVMNAITGGQKSGIVAGDIVSFRYGDKITATSSVKPVDTLFKEGKFNIDDYIEKGNKYTESFQIATKDIDIKKDFSTPISEKKLEDLVKKIGCPGFKGADGGRATFDVGTNCQIKGANLINSGMKNASSAQIKNFAAFANRAASLGRGVMKYGVIPEALYVAADSLIRVGMGDNFNEAFLRATDYLRPGDQTKLAEMLEADRFFGPEVAGIIGKSLDYKNQLANVQSLQDQKANLENLSGGGEFDYIGDLSQDVKNIDAQLKQATDNLNKFKMTDAEQLYANQMQKEVDDARSAGSFFTKLKSKFRDIEPDSDIETLGVPEKTQEDLNKRMLPQAPTIYKIENGKLIEKNLSEATQTEIMDHVRLLKPYGYEFSTKDLLKEQNILRGMSLSDQEQLYGPEATYGFSGTVGEPINKPTMEKKQNVIGDIEKEIIGQTNVANPFDIDISDIGTGLRGFAAAGGGIAKEAGDSSGPPPESGPNSQGLQGLMKRVRNL